MKQTPLTVTLLFIPSYEIYGQVLLMLEKYEESKNMFAQSLQERMGRVNGLIGLARSHAKLGNVEEAGFFYAFVSKQLSGADEGNLHVEEAEVWKQTKNLERIQEYWSWPY